MKNSYFILFFAVLTFFSTSAFSTEVATKLQSYRAFGDDGAFGFRKDSDARVCLSGIKRQEMLPDAATGSVFSCKDCAKSGSSFKDFNYIVLDTSFDENSKSAGEGRKIEKRHICVVDLISSVRNGGCFDLPESEIQNSAGGMLKIDLNQGLVRDRASFEVPAYQDPKNLTYAKRGEWAFSREVEKYEMLKTLNGFKSEEEMYSTGIDSHKATSSFKISSYHMNSAYSDKLKEKAQELGLDLKTSSESYGIFTTSTDYSVSGPAPQLAKFYRHALEISKNNEVMKESISALHAQLADESFVYKPTLRPLPQGEVDALLEKQATQALNAAGRIISREKADYTANKKAGKDTFKTNNYYSDGTGITQEFKKACQDFAQNHPDAREAYCKIVDPCFVTPGYSPTESQKLTK